MHLIHGPKHGISSCGVCIRLHEERMEVFTEQKLLRLSMLLASGVMYGATNSIGCSSVAGKIVSAFFSAWHCNLKV